jgi:hypothetical protein
MGEASIAHPVAVAPHLSACLELAPLRFLQTVVMDALSLACAQARRLLFRSISGPASASRAMNNRSLLPTAN